MNFTQNIGQNKFWRENNMVRMLTEEEKKLSDIIEPYFDYKKCKLKENAPTEVVEALNRLKEINKKYIDPNNL